MFEISISSKGAMEAVNHFKNSAMEQRPLKKTGRSLKSLMGRGNFLINRFLFFPFFMLMLCVLSIDSINAQKFNCKKDKLDESTVRVVPPGVSNLVLEQQSEVSVFNAKGKRIASSEFTLSSNNENVKNDRLTFWVENKTKPWDYLDGKLVEIDGNITITANKCNMAYSFPFKVRQAYTFDNQISCNGDRREFAVARYKNVLGKDLFVVMDINRRQLYLLEGPISIDASGVVGKEGSPGYPGQKGTDGTERNRDGSRGGDGGNGGHGGNGGNGGEITVYLPHNIQEISVNVAGGAGGTGGVGGKGGRGGEGYSEPRKAGKLTVNVKVGKDGPSGNDGNPGDDGNPGRDGSFNKEHVDDIKKYFQNVNQANFDIENIEE